MIIEVREPRRPIAQHGIFSIFQGGDDEVEMDLLWRFWILPGRPVAHPRGDFALGPAPPTARQLATWSRGVSPQRERFASVTAAGFELHAWGDESARTVGLETPAYLLGAVIADPARCETYRDRMREFQATRSKLHWHELDTKHRDLVIEAVASFDIYHVVVIGAPMDPRKQERARALCLERLTWELDEQHEVSRLILESRPQSLIRRGRRTIDALRGRNVLLHGMRVEHGLPLEEPMRWIADQVIGAVGESLVGNRAWLKCLESTVEVIRIDL